MVMTVTISIAQHVRAKVVNYLTSTPVYYVYPQWHTVSFTLVSHKHIEQLKKYFRLYAIDELAFPYRDIFCKPVCVIHPYFFIVQRNPQRFLYMLEKFKAVIGIDVADTDMIGRVGVQLANLANCMIVPSTFCKFAYERSGVKVPIHVVPHGLSKAYYDPRKLPTDKYLKHLLELKRKRNYIYVLFFLIHSGERKGVDLVYDVMREIVKMYNNVKLIVKIGVMNEYHKRIVESMGGFIFSKFLNEHNLIALYDMCDIYPLFSRGGGFELCITPDTNVITLEGIKPIVKVKEGDFVLTHLGRFRKVVRKFERDYNGKLIEIIPYGFENYSIKLTPEHPVLVLRTHIYNIRKHEYILSELPKWIKAKDVKKGDCVLIPVTCEKYYDITFDLAEFIRDDINNGLAKAENEYIYYCRTGSPRYTQISYNDIQKATGETKKIVCLAIKYYLEGKEPKSPRIKKVIEYLKQINYKPQYVKIKRFIKVDEKFARLLGYYLAEGSINENNHTVEISFGDETQLVEDCAKLVREIFGYEPSIKKYENKKVTKVIICNKAIAKFLKSICGKDAYSKVFPFFILFGDKKVLSELIWALVLGDGSVRENEIRYVTVNKNLAFGVYYGLIRLGYKPRIYYHKTLNQWHIEVNLPTENLKKDVNINPLIPRNEDYVLHSNKMWFSRNRKYLILEVKEVREIEYNGKVYNLEVKEDNSYTANFIAVHNCGLEALARGEIVIAGSVGSWTDYLPDFCLVRKVHRVKFWKHTNPLHDIHCGFGYEVDVNEAIQKMKDIIENLDDYKARVKEYWERVKHEWTWEAVGMKLKNIIERYV